MTQRSEPGLISNWVYDSCTKGIGKLCSASANNGYSRSHSYDSQGRSLSTSTTIDVAYTSSVTYDPNGRVATQTWPTGLAIKYVYTALGYLKEVRHNSSNALYWQANAFDVAGHLLTQTYGNGLVTNQTFSATTGRLATLTAGAGNGVQNLSYNYDSIGNLTSRNDGNSSNGVANESYSYDSLNRLTSSTVNASVPGTVVTNYAYNAIGNLTCKSDLGSCSSGSPNLTYGAVVSGRTLPHALASVTGTVHGAVNPSYSYDANGNLLTGAGRTVTYTSFNMTAQITAPGKNGVAYQYDSEHMRVRETNLSPTNSVLGYTYYLHPDAANGLSYEVDKTSGGSVTLHKHYITAGGQAVALVTYTGTTWTTKYLHRDHLGSVITITDASGAVIERLGYDSWGKRRNANGVTDPNDTLAGANTDRGYTNAEHIESLAIINMNGRVYDPTLGRFMGSDPIVQDPTDLQSFNRYSYVLNNPLGYTDPTGYSWCRDDFCSSNGSTGGPVRWDEWVVSGKRDDNRFPSSCGVGCTSYRSDNAALGLVLGGNPAQQFNMVSPYLLLTNVDASGKATAKLPGITVTAKRLPSNEKFSAPELSETMFHLTIIVGGGNMPQSRIPDFLKETVCENTDIIAGGVGGLFGGAVFAIKTGNTQGIGAAAIVGAATGAGVAVAARYSPIAALVAGGLLGAAGRTTEGYSHSGIVGTLGDAANAVSDISMATFVGGVAGAIEGALPGSRLIPPFGRIGSSIITGNAGASAALAGSLAANATSFALIRMCRRGGN